MIHTTQLHNIVVYTLRWALSYVWMALNHLRNWPLEPFLFGRSTIHPSMKVYTPHVQNESQNVDENGRISQSDPRKTDLLLFPHSFSCYRTVASSGTKPTKPNQRKNGQFIFLLLSETDRTRSSISFYLLFSLPTTILILIKTTQFWVIINCIFFAGILNYLRCLNLDPCVE